MVVKSCRCDTKPCAAACPCTKASMRCNPDCHMARPWESVPCLNTDIGLQVKGMKPVEIRKALCDAGLSPIGDKAELQKRLAVQFTSLAAQAGGGGGEGGGGKVEGGGEEKSSSGPEKGANVGELMDVILANEGDFQFILSLSGKMVKPTSSKAEFRKAYFLLSSKVHPDKNGNSASSKKAFQAVLESFERLANPEKFEEDEDDDSKPTRKRQKKERFTRGNSGCFPTLISCPRCGDKWNTRNLGLEDGAYNFLMQGVKQYLCGGCFAKFGCMTAIHHCPHCRHTFEYDPDDYHRKITCGRPKCDRPFGFWMFKVAEYREMQIRREVKEENEKISKTRAQQRRRGARAEKRVGTLTNEQRVQEQLFILKLIDNCPKCGWLLERQMHAEDAKEHLESCNDEKQIKVYQAEQAARKKREESKKKATETQEDIQAFKTWEFNGRQVGQLWMLGEGVLARECGKYSLETDGPKHMMIARLSRVIRERERKAITMGGENLPGSHDITPIHKVDAEDLPSNMNSLTQEDLQCVAASYGLDFDSDKDVKVDLLKKLESARLKGTGLLMILDEPKRKGKKRKSDEDPDFKLDDGV